MFYCYDTNENPNLWAAWYAAQSSKVRAKHDVVLEFLEQRLGSLWRLPHADLLGDGLIEIRITGDVQWRVLGFFGPSKFDFTVVLVCYHKGRVYTPKSAIKTAKRIMAEIETDLRKRKRCVRPQ